MRTAGILMPITSLPSPYGVGTLGQCARDFIQFLYRAGQTYWQILPICPTGYGDSPYQSFSSYAGAPEQPGFSFSASSARAEETRRRSGCSGAS